MGKINLIHDRKLNLIKDVRAERPRAQERFPSLAHYCLGTHPAGNSFQKDKSERGGPNGVWEDENLARDILVIPFMRPVRDLYLTSSRDEWYHKRARNAKGLGGNQRFAFLDARRERPPFYDAIHLLSLLRGEFDALLDAAVTCIRVCTRLSRVCGIWPWERSQEWAHRGNLHTTVLNNSAVFGSHYRVLHRLAAA
jgi:hypothetical protein